jgi:phosphohistidine phosphatase
MLRITFVRHATAQDRGETLPDIERPLIKKGIKEARAVARYLASRDACPGLMISSFANRAIETAHLFAAAFRYPSQRILLRHAFYGDTKIDDLAGEIRKQPDKVRSLMLFGHDPAFSQLAAHLIQGFHETIPKAGSVTAEFPADRWRDLQAGSGRLIEFATPTRLKERKKQTRNELENRLQLGIEGVLAGVDRAAARAVRKDVRKSARKIAKGFAKALEGQGPARPKKPKRPAA